MKKAIEEMKPYQRFVDHFLSTYEAKIGAKYPFMGEDGRAIKRLLGIYGIDDLIALWDEFLNRNWNWVNYANKTVRVSHNLRVFQSKLTDLLEDGAYKKRIKSIPKIMEEMVGKIGGNNV